MLKTVRIIHKQKIRAYHSFKKTFGLIRDVSLQQMTLKTKASL